MHELVNANSVRIPLADKSVHHIVTSPPYFNLRAYQAGEGEIGAEPTPEEFIEALVQVGRECWRVLRDDGVMVVNLGDSYGHGTGAERQPGDALLGAATAEARGIHRNGMRAGDRMNIPHRVASALQADGWLWRDTVIWRKKSAMPESVNGWRWERCRVKVKAQVRGVNHAGTREGYQSSPPHPDNGIIGASAEYADCPGCEKCRDTDGLVLRRGSWRTTSAHEYIFVFAKGMGYFADREAVKKPHSKASIEDFKRRKTLTNKGDFGGVRSDLGRSRADYFKPGGANPRDVLTFKPTPFKGKHYATFPTTLPEFFIRAYTSEKGVCAECGAPWARVVDGQGDGSWRHRDYAAAVEKAWQRGGSYVPETQNTLGFRRTCTHAAPAVPAVVVDPFVGSGSTLIAARELGRYGVGFDLNLSYLLNVAGERMGRNKRRAWASGEARQVEQGDYAGTMFEDVG